jgi:hypothetical protein
MQFILASNEIHAAAPCSRSAMAMQRQCSGAIRACE